MAVHYPKDSQEGAKDRWVLKTYASGVELKFPSYRLALSAARDIQEETGNASGIRLA